MAIKQRLGEAVLYLRVKGDEFRQGIAGAKKQTGDLATDTEKKTGRIRKAFGSIRQSAADAAKEIPLIGGAVSKMVTAMTGPVGIAVAAIAGIGLAAVGVVKQVGKVADETRIMREEIGLSAEAAQGWAHVAKQMNTDADTMTDIFREMGIRLGELATTGSGPAKDALDAIGLSLSDLQGLKPEEQFALLHQEIGKIEDPTRRAFIAEELFGGAVEKASGLINANTAELVNQAKAYAENNAHSEDVIKAQEEMGRLWGEIKSALAPVVTEFAASLIPALRDFLSAVKPLMPVVKNLISLGLTPLKNAFTIISGGLNTISALLRGDFTGAWTEIQRTVLGVAKNMVSGVKSAIGLLPDKFVPDGWKTSIDNAEAALNTALDNMETHADTTATNVGNSSGAIDSSFASTATNIDSNLNTAFDNAETGASDLASKVDEQTLLMDSFVERSRDKLEEYRKKQGEVRDRASELRERYEEEFPDLVTQTENVTTATTSLDTALHNVGTSSTELKDQVKDTDAPAMKTAIEDQITAAIMAAGDEFSEVGTASTTLKDQVVDTDAPQIGGAMEKALDWVKAVSEEILALKRAALEAETAIAGMGGSVPSAASQAAGHTFTPGGLGFDHVSGRSASKGRWDREERDAWFRSSSPGDWIQDPHDDVGTPTYYANDGGTLWTISQSARQFEKDNAHWAVRRARELGIPGFASGGLLRGVNNPFGRLIRVGENRTDEMVMPLPKGMLDALRSGGMRGQAGDGGGLGTPLVVKIGDTTVADLVVQGRTVAERQARWD